MLLMFNLQLCGNRRINAAVTFILPALWVCVQWCIKCRAVGRLDRPSHNTLHGLMPPLAGKWIKEGGGWTVCLLKINPHSSSVDHWAWQGFCLSVAARLALVRMSSSCRWFIRFTAKRWDANSAWEQEFGQGHGWLPWGQTRPYRPSKVN